MSGYSVTRSIGRVTAGEQDSIWAPRTVHGNVCGTILVHGSDAPDEFMDNVAQPASVRLAAGLATAGIPCIAGVFGGNMWGNDTVMTAITDAWTVLKATFPTIRTDKLCLVGVSMGGAAVARYTQLHPTQVAAAVGIIPAYDVRYEYEQVAGTSAAIAAAWGFPNGNPLPAEADIAAGAAAAVGVPLLTGYSTVDAIVPPAPVLAYTAAVGGAAIITDTTAGHSDAAVAGMPLTTLARFLISHTLPL